VADMVAFVRSLNLKEVKKQDEKDATRRGACLLPEQVHH
jgi:hypothetical protein